MFKIAAGVGFGQTNNPVDVAFIQMALKIAKKGVYRSNKTPYWTRRIDGIYTYHLASAIARYKEAHFSEKELQTSGLLNESIEAIGSSSSKSYMRLVRTIPSRYKTAVYGFGTIRNRTVIYQQSTSKRGLANYRVEDLSLPNDLAMALLRYLDQLFQGYSVIPTIEIITVDNDGRFNVRVGIKGGRIIDAETGKITPVSEQTKSDAINLFRLSVNNSNMPSKRLWRFTGQSEIIFTSKKHYDFLKPSAGAKAWLLWQLGSHKTRHQSRVIERALDAYDRFRLGAKLRPETERFMMEVFGDDWAQIKNQQANKERKAFEYKRRIAELQTDIRIRRTRLLSLENKLRENLGIKRTDILGSLLFDIISKKSIKRASKLVGSATQKSVNKKLTSNNILEKKANESIADSIGNFTEAVVSTVFSPPEDITDVVVFGLGVASIALLAFGGALILASAGSAAAIVGTVATVARVGSVVVRAGRFLDKASVFIDTAVTVYEGVSDILRDQELDEELTFLRAEIGPAQNALAGSLEKLNVFIAAAKSENLVSIADFGFSQSELDQGIKELEPLKAA